MPVFIAAALAGCGEDPSLPDELTVGLSVPEIEKLKKGRDGYVTYCVGCHGEAGDGNGPAARFLNPKPRDFRTARVKFAAVPAGALPRDEDLMRTIKHGLHGTGMPAFNLLSEDQRVAIIAYVRTFFVDPAEPDAVMVVGADPWLEEPEKGVAEGERLYHGLAGCWSCHPAYVSREKLYEHTISFDMPFGGFRDDLYAAPAKESAWGADIKPTDFWMDRVKTGSTAETVVVVVAAGVGGTAMPTWGDSLTGEQLWALAYYVESLAKMRDTAWSRARMAELRAAPEWKPPGKPSPEGWRR